MNFVPIENDMKIHLWLLSVFLLTTVLAAPDPSLNGTVFYTMFPLLAAGSGPLAVTLQLRYIAIQSETRFECLAVYHPTAKGKYLQGSVRRPSLEHTKYNRNVCIAYATHRTAVALAPQTKALADSLLTGLGLNPHDYSEDLSTPSGVGNMIGRIIMENRYRDGVNQLGDEDRSYHRINYTDYTGYVPVNDHIRIRDPDAWQPLVTTDSRSRPTAQIYLTPQLEFLKTLVINQSNAIIADQRDRFDEHPRRYRQKTKEVMDAQVALTDYQKIVCEFFDDKIRSFNGIGDYLVGLKSNFDLEFHTLFNFVVNSVIHEATAPVWKLKTKYNAVRPITSVRYLYSGKRIWGWGGPGKGIVRMDGKDWNSYLKTDFFPDYPSGTACLCSAWTEAAKLLYGNNTINFVRHIPQGSSVVEPGVVPAQAFDLVYTSFDQIAEECMMSRVWGGVHFMQAVTESRKLCKEYGRQFYHKAISMLQGL